MNMHDRLNTYRQIIEDDLKAIPQVEKIPLFYAPIRYMNDLPGKRIRPLLTIVSGLSVGGKLSNLRAPASAVELLHNFSLVHDDIMDDDDLRRGEPTVHVKWDLGTAILTGDGLLGLAFRKLLETPEINDLQMARLFTDAMIEICEGQALDKTFENKSIVSEVDYLEMIEKKTVTLIRLSCQLGGIAAGAEEKHISWLTKFGYNMGMGFQIQDDMLDIYADEDTLGKPVGSDLAMDKKTIITVRLKEKTGQSDYQSVSVEQFKQLLAENDILREIKTMVNTYFDDAISAVNHLPENEFTQLLKDIGTYVQNREK